MNTSGATPQHGEVIELSDHIRYVRFDDGGVAFDTHTREAPELNATASEILYLVDRGSTVAQITETLAKLHTGGAEETRKDIEGFVRTLIERGWARVRQS